MSWLIKIAVGYFVLLILSGCAGERVSPAVKIDADSGYSIAKQIRYSFTLSNTSGKLLEKAQFQTYLPVSRTSHQKVVKIVSNYTYQQIQDELGNSMMSFELKDIPPYGARIVSITVDLLMADNPVAALVGDRERFLSRERYIESDDGRIVSLAGQLHAESAGAMARKDYEWVAHNIVSESYIAEDLGAVYALEHRKGDCTEFSYLLTALYRAQKIPARAMGGYVFPGNGVMKAVDYHNWTEFYLGGAWQIADAQKGVFLGRQTDYVAMRVIATQSKFASQRFSYAGEGLRVEMN